MFGKNRKLAKEDLEKAVRFGWISDCIFQLGKDVKFNIRSSDGIIYEYDGSKIVSVSLDSQVDLWGQQLFQDDKKLMLNKIQIEAIEKLTKLQYQMEHKNYCFFGDDKLGLNFIYDSRAKTFAYEEKDFRGINKSKPIPIEWLYSLAEIFRGV